MVILQITSSLPFLEETPQCLSYKGNISQTKGEVAMGDSSFFVRAKRILFEIGGIKF